MNPDRIVFKSFFDRKFFNNSRDTKPLADGSNNFLLIVGNVVCSVVSDRFSGPHTEILIYTYLTGVFLEVCILCYILLIQMISNETYNDVLPLVSDVTFPL